MKFYDRVNEMQILQENEVQAERSAVFTVLMGRRRVGKTSLITHAMEGREYAYLFISRDNEAVLCRKLQRSLEEQLGIHVYGDLTHFRDLFEVIITTVFFPILIRLIKAHVRPFMMNVTN